MPKCPVFKSLLLLINVTKSMNKSDGVSKYLILANTLGQYTSRSLVGGGFSLNDCNTTN